MLLLIMCVLVCVWGVCVWVNARAPHSVCVKMTACVLPKCPFRNNNSTTTLEWIRAVIWLITHRTFHSAFKGGDNMTVIQARIHSNLKKCRAVLTLQATGLLWPLPPFRGGHGLRNTHMRTLNNTVWGGTGVNGWQCSVCVCVCSTPRVCMIVCVMSATRAHYACCVLWKGDSRLINKNSLFKRLIQPPLWCVIQKP